MPVSSSFTVDACLAQTPPRQSAISSMRTAPDSGPCGSCCARSQQPELVLEGVAVLVGDDVLLRERPGAGAELVLEDLEEAGVDVDRLVEGAVERPDLVARGAACRLGGAAVEHGLGSLPLLAEARQLARPVGLHRVHRADDAALGVLVGVGAGLALGERLGSWSPAACDLVCGSAGPPPVTSPPAADDPEEQREDQDDDAADAAAHDHAARRATAARRRPHLRGVEGDVVVEAHRGPPSPGAWTARRAAAPRLDGDRPSPCPRAPP